MKNYSIYTASELALIIEREEKELKELKQFWTETQDMQPTTDFNSVQSNFVYALEKGYKIKCEVEPKFVEGVLRRNFGRDITFINNKYAVMIGCEIYYQHDSKTYLIYK